MVETASRITEESVDVDDLMKALCNTWKAGIFLTLDPENVNMNQKYELDKQTKKNEFTPLPRGIGMIKFGN
jgi:hypothetical protein